MTQAIQLILPRRTKFKEKLFNPIFDWQKYELRRAKEHAFILEEYVYVRIQEHKQLAKEL